jgi:hypothetical protein
LDSSLFSHPVAEQPHADALTTPQDARYGSLFLQPSYTPAPASDDDEGLDEPRPQRQARAAHDPSGRRGRR